MKWALHRQSNVNMSPGSGAMRKPCSSMTPPYLQEPLNLPNPTHCGDPCCSVIPHMCWFRQLSLIFTHSLPFQLPIASTHPCPLVLADDCHCSLPPFQVPILFHLQLAYLL